MLIDKLFRATQKTKPKTTAYENPKKNTSTAGRVAIQSNAHGRSAAMRLDKNSAEHKQTSRLTRLSGDVNDARIARLERFQSQYKNHSTVCSQSKTTLRVPAILQTKSLSEFFQIAEKEQRL